MKDEMDSKLKEAYAILRAKDEVMDEMDGKLKEAYALLRAKDEVMSERYSGVAAALCVAAMGVLAICSGEWICAAIALTCAAIFGSWTWIFAVIADVLIERLGFSEVELERLDLA